MNLQEKIISILLDNSKNKKQASEKIQSLLNISEKTARSILDCMRPLTLYEAEIVIHSLQLNLELILSSQDDQSKTPYKSILLPFINVKKSPEYFLDTLLANIDMLNVLKTKNIRYLSSEFPIFYYCMIPELMLFKLYSFNQILWKDEAWSKSKFSLKKLSENGDIIDKIKRLWNFYKDVPSEEIWSVKCLNNTMNHLKILRDIGAFEDEQDYFILLDKMNDLLQHLEEMAASDIKKDKTSLGAKYLFYVNKFVFSTNMIYVVTAKQSMIYITIDNPDFGIAVDDEVVEHFNNQWYHVKNNSSQINVSGHQERKKFFNQLHEAINSMR